MRALISDAARLHNAAATSAVCQSTEHIETSMDARFGGVLEARGPTKA